MTSSAGPSASGNNWTGMLSMAKDTPSRHTGTCELCGKDTDHITKHHLYPRSATRRAFFTPEQKDSLAAMCWPCHCIIHQLILADVLARDFHSIELLNTHSRIQAWLQWAESWTMEHLHSLMVPPRLRQPQNQSPIQNALDAIWVRNENTFPRLEGKGKRTRALAIRGQIRQFPGLAHAAKPDIEAAMRANPEYREWQQWVFGGEG
ncbi:hypothetical protein B0H16DRAFT_1603905 [Mycena metata]|uniref:HNH domain-containing protein n=1 Tax=Mycena metata TaxID=1033252 RepID=A0AAD7HI53_9AGAR|nr:hypothetical protein B0H16DRAFT_1603905 [Mycena metata]